MRRLTILLAALGALLLLPAAQAFATGTATVHIAGEGSGEVNGVGGYHFRNLGGEEEASGIYEGGPPPIECSYISPGPETGVCETSLAQEEEEGPQGIAVRALPKPGFELAGFEVEGASIAQCSGEEHEETSEYYGSCFALVFGEGNIEITAFFAKCSEGSKKRSCPSGPSGPTNRRLLTLTKAGTGQGAVASKPKGIKCGNTCPSSEASLYKESSVVLTAKAAVTVGSNLEGWEGCDSSTNTGTEGTCTVKMTEARNVVAKFGGTSKAITNPKTLTVSKVDGGFETGYGTVKASGIACEADCTSTEAQYFGGTTEPKVKAATTVTLLQAPAAGSEFVGWTGCDSEVEGKCVVSMSSDKEVTAEYAALPKNDLTLTKVGYGAVKSKPKGVSCGNTCSSAIASLPSDATVVLAAKAGTGSSLTGWEGCDSSTNTGIEGTCTVAMSSARNVKATFSAAVKPLANPQALTLSKAGSGYGTVKASGLACEAACTSTVVNYYGGATEPKPKAAATVTMVAISAPGSGAVQWSGCDSEPEIEGKGIGCVVSMSAAREVTATFDELE